MNKFPPLTESDRVLILAPHPDDESLATGGLIQTALAAGAEVRVLYASTGDNNPWPQRVKERRLRIGPEDRVRWGEIRCQEALAALSHLGVRSETKVGFLGLPDQGFTGALLATDEKPVDALKTAIEEFRPTLLVSPSLYDRHPDHNALAVFVNLVLQQAQVLPERLYYVVHGPAPLSGEGVVSLMLTPEQQQRKREAILAHGTQTFLSRLRLLSYAKPVETFYKAAVPAAVQAGYPAISSTLSGDVLQVRIPASAVSFLGSKLLIAAESVVEGGSRWVLQVPKESGIFPLKDAKSGEPCNEAFAHVTTQERLIKISLSGLAPLNQLFLKLQTPTVFFDRYGWYEVPLLAADSKELAEPLPPALPVASNSPAWRSTLVWAALSLLMLCWLGSVLSDDIRRPWVNFIDYNGAVWSQAAHNILRAGLATTEGASTGFYFGALPIPPRGYYLHHPPLLHLALAGLFTVFGEHEWAARLLPITCSLLSGVFLWLLVRSCLGARTAAFSVAVFACLPMELRYGQMVNFEPLILMLILGGLLSLRYWKVSGKTQWQIAAMLAFVIGLWVDWAMYLFMVVLCGYWFCRRDPVTRRMAWFLTGSAAASGAAYLLNIRRLRPDAWENLTRAFVCRMGSQAGDSTARLHFTQTQWLHRIGETLNVHFLPAGLILALAGGWLMFRKRHGNEGLRWLAWASLVVAGMDLIFVGGFQNDSYIHPYIAFYLIAPIAIAGGVALSEVTAWAQRQLAARHLNAHAGTAIACFILALTAHFGIVQADELRRQFLVLDFKTPEPPNFIPALGSVIQQNFPPDAEVICNFLPVYGPHLGYYAQRNLLSNVLEYRFWQTYLKSPEKNIGGLVWLNSDHAREIVAKLPFGSKRYLQLGNMSFCIWKPSAPFDLKRAVSKSNRSSIKTM